MVSQTFPSALVPHLLCNVIDDKITDLNTNFQPMIEEKQAEIAELQEEKRDLMEFIDNEANHQATLDFWKQ